MLAVAAISVSACSHSPPAPLSPPVTDRVHPALPGKPGPQIVVEGTATWRTDHVGCATMMTDHGQMLRLVGQVATDHERAVFEGGPTQEHVRIVGYTFDPMTNATVCGSGLPFVAEKVTPTAPQ
ncbi:hypothetical protein [Amycolatopsis sp. TNS106]|uniref:hypothetical protein n=1 Tax=Amycolatopsis sp. TNS106 TaxID=2861750 RepID=UPI001C56B9B7|nr:hypothetical protein [Amycolatopsis sp. TNS106]